MINYSPSNGTEWGFFLDNNCYRELGCKYFNPEMLTNRDAKITCHILFRLLDQMALSEEEFPEIYQFNDDELQDGCPAVCLKRRSE